MKAAIVSVDTLIYQKLKEDDCAPIVKRMLGQVSFRTELIQPVPNDKEVIRKVLARIADAEIADLVLTIGGIGCRDEDWTPEATKSILDKEIPGSDQSLLICQCNIWWNGFYCYLSVGEKGHGFLESGAGSECSDPWCCRSSVWMGQGIILNYFPVCIHAGIAHFI